MDIPKEKLTKILKAAVQAPSGDNSQPWKFQVLGNKIHVLNIPEKDTSLFNYKQTSNYIALGAAIENISVASKSLGYSAAIVVFPDDKNNDFVAEITLEESAHSTISNLDLYIEARSSNRKKYYAKEISAEILKDLENSVEDLPGKLTFVSTKEKVSEIAKIVSAGEKIALENRNIHDFLFEHVTWNKQDDAVHHGFYIKTFEFKPPQEAVFKLFRNWKTLSFFNIFKVSDFIAKDMEGVYKSSAAFGAISISNFTKEELVQSGILLERVWLTATKLGLSMQLSTTIPLLMIPIREGNRSGISDTHVSLIRDRYSVLEKEFNTDQEIITLVFRLGYSEPPSANTTRFEPRVEPLTNHAKI